MEPSTCWICLEAGGDTLVHPCACAGSMGGVHVACIERWVRYRRRAVAGADAPRCPVCQVRYAGSDELPGFGAYLRRLALGAVDSIPRLVMPCLFCFGLCFAMDGYVDWAPAGFRTALFGLVALTTAHRTCTLAASVPLRSLVQRCPYLRCFVVLSAHKLRQHALEASTMLVALPFLCAAQGTPQLVLAPLFAGGIVLALWCAAQVPHLVCANGCSYGATRELWQAIAQAGSVIAKDVRRVWRRGFHPLAAGPHSAVALSVAPLSKCSLPRLFVTAVCMWHSGVLALCAVEVTVVRNLRWRRGKRWWFALWDASVVAAFATRQIGFASQDLIEYTLDSAVQSVCVVWVCLLACVTCSMNCHLCFHHYKTWRRRHGTFTLHANAIGVSSSATPSAAVAAAAAVGTHAAGNVYVALPGGP